MFLVISHTCPVPFLSTVSPDVKERISVNKEFCASLCLSTLYHSVHRPRHPDISTFVCACASLLPSPFSRRVRVTMFESLLFFSPSPLINSIVPCFVGAVKIQLMKKKKLNRKKKKKCSVLLRHVYLNDIWAGSLKVQIACDLYCKCILYIYIYIYIYASVCGGRRLTSIKRKGKSKKQQKKKLVFLQ